ncbi:MAG: SDR family NAD(P)-dependent oxidoreductase [Porticoccaceae bacterium]|nr:SDR family NAD(P)-dependent oxidoreductase [Porticoccaceae bacterium]
MAHDFFEKIVVITNAADDLGHAYSQYFLARGAKLVLHDGREKDLLALLEKLEWHQNIVLHSACDLAVPDVAVTLTEQAIIHCGSVDILINNRPPQTPYMLEEWSPMQLQDALQRHLLSTILTIQAMLPCMQDKGFGRIIATSSGAGAFGAAGYAAYSAAGAGVTGFMRSLSLELANTSITVNTIAPMTLDDHDGYLATQDPLIDRELYLADKVAPIVAYLTSDKCQLSGRLLSITGGRLAHIFASTVAGYFNHDEEGSDIDANLSAILDTNYALIPECAADELLMINV